MPLNSFAEVIPIIFGQSWVPADGTAYKTIVAAQPTIWRIDTLLALSDDAASRIMTVSLVDPSSTAHLLGTCTVPAHAGEAPNPLVDVLLLLLPTSQVGLVMPAGWSIEAHAAGDIVNAVSMLAMGGYF